MVPSVFSFRSTNFLSLTTFFLSSISLFFLFFFSVWYFLFRYFVYFLILVSATVTPARFISSFFFLYDIPVSIGARTIPFVIFPSFLLLAC